MQRLAFSTQVCTSCQKKIAITIYTVYLWIGCKYNDICEWYFCHISKCAHINVKESKACKFSMVAQLFSLSKAPEKKSFIIYMYIFLHWCYLGQICIKFGANLKNIFKRIYAETAPCKGSFGTIATSASKLQKAPYLMPY